MTSSAQDIARIVLIGIGATAVMDAWGLLLKRFDVPPPDFALVGRWIGHLARGRWAHDAIAKAAPVRGELAIGWLAHYAIGIAFAAMLVGVCGIGWIRDPSPLPALCMGIATVVAPLFVMQPAMGAGVAASKTNAPAVNCLKSLANHAVFGIGLYAAAVTVQRAAT